MKIIVSHDIDHLTVFEHYKDAIIPKFLIRNTIELAKGKIRLADFCYRHKGFITNKWQNIEELMNFNDSLHIKSNFFIGLNNGLGLSYSTKKAIPWIQKIKNRGFEVGVHGISYENLSDIEKEYRNFENHFGSKHFGIRMHYLRDNGTTFQNLAKVGYVFDATEVGFKNPYKIGDMWEFPVQIMEGWIFYKGHRYMTTNLEEAKKLTLIEIQKATENQLKYLTILFHDRYYEKGFSIMKDWYEWLLLHLKNEGYEFITYSKAVEELNAKQN